MKSSIYAAAWIAAGLCVVQDSAAHDYKINARPQDHAPIGVMRDHVHKTGEWMLSYRYHFMNMEENYDGSSDISDADVLSRFPVAPTNMSMTMHMVGAMYGLTDQLTLSVMGGFTTNSMDHIRRNGTTFETEGEDFADTSINALYEFYHDDMHRLQANFGISLPTGSINERSPAGMTLPITMQTGSGTYDLLPGISYAGHSGAYSWGGQANAVLRTGKNNRGYRLGDAYQLTGWGAYQLSDMFSISARLDGRDVSDVNGNDRTIPGVMSPPMNPTLYEQTQLNGLVGVNMLVQDGYLEGHRLAFEVGAPLYQRRDRDRLGEEYQFVLGWQKAF